MGLTPSTMLVPRGTQGETLELKVALIQAAKQWERLTKGCVLCPVVFDPKDVIKTLKLDEAMRDVDAMIGLYDSWLSVAEEG